MACLLYNSHQTTINASALFPLLFCRIHRAQFQHAFLQYTLKSIKDIDKYVAQAEVRMKEEEEQLEQNRLRYLNQRSGTQVSLGTLALHVLGAQKYVKYRIRRG